MEDNIATYIYSIDQNYSAFRFCTGTKFGLLDKKTGKVLLKPEYEGNFLAINLVKIYEQKLLKEKLKQLKEDLK